MHQGSHGDFVMKEAVLPQTLPASLLASSHYHCPFSLGHTDWGAEVGVCGHLGVGETLNYTHKAAIHSCPHQTSALGHGKTPSSTLSFRGNHRGEKAPL